MALALSLTKLRGKGIDGMWFVSLLAFLVFTFLIGYSCQEEFTETLPVTTGGLILLLYILAICRNMLAIGVIAVAGLLIFAAALVIMGKKGRMLCLQSMKAFFITPRTIITIVALFAVMLLTASHVATWWDDINYWATDAKALYFLNGFTGKYGNVAPEFGDYPPAIQIMKWCVARLCSGEYREGLSYAGYYAMNMIFALPLLKKTRDGNPFIHIIGMAIVFLLPGVVNDVWSHGACADVTMGIIYGAVLISIFDFEHSAGFYFGRLIILLSLLPLTKSVGFEWALFAAVLFILCMICFKDTYLDKLGKGYVKKGILTIVTAVSFQLSWWIYCLLNRRIAKLTSSGVHMAAGGYSLPDNAGEKAGLFARGFAFCPMHTDMTVMLDLSSLTMLVIILLTILGLYIAKMIVKREAVLFSIYTLVTALVAYGIIFVGHITIFATETQYSTPEVMAISISRYAAPFTIGMLMLLLYTINNRSTSKWVIIISAVFVLVTTDYIAAYNCLWGYRDNTGKALEDRASMVDDNGRKYIDTVEGDMSLWGHRVLYFRDASQIHWVKDTYISHEVSPVPTVYADINPAATTGEDIANAIVSYHPEYIYVDDVSGMENGLATKDLFKDFITSEAGASEFEYCHVYRVK